MASITEDSSVRLVSGETEVFQAGPSLEQPNQRASVIVVQATSSEQRTDTVDVEGNSETQNVQDSHESIGENTISSPVLTRRRPRGKKISISCFQCMIKFFKIGEDNDDEESSDSEPPPRKLKSDAGGFIPEKEDKSAIEDEEDGQVRNLLYLM